MSTPWEEELSIAQSAVLKAARLTKTVLSTVTEVSKADSSPVTIADFAAQALLISILHAQFPNDKFVGEEDSSTLRKDETLRNKVYELYSAALDRASSVDEMLDFIDMGGRGTGGPQGRFWAMDPVDGTATFLTGEQYAVSLALLEDGKEVLAAVVYPNLRLEGGRIKEKSVDRDGLGVMLSAVRGRGARITWLKGFEGPYETEVLGRLPDSDMQRLHVIDCDRNRASHRDVMRGVCEKLGAEFPGTDVWSSHVRYAGLIIGGGDLLVRIPSGRESWSCIWDHAGAQLIYREVGGKITDLDGREIDFARGRYLSGNRGLVFAREGIHAEVLRVAREAVGDGWVS
ncbi:myo-inositol-1(or 4)-monophosphatase [Pochonia chlamydosporia 170]|uniref:Myo-inositol-1(Or 4)-monophosphatase n=1 Tax=Pochonia chlamydosporia 170 TaxID=1380566 RepID=A0A179FY77_METCM|nr:myo-inositol-1(or 4)-monophosphatase [Pochonia chlamydosporia 170]OAQ70625.1 myo-inositol-1(or 4)-monophosphatase [Pochonia chlamydosporia 170]